MGNEHIDVEYVANLARIKLSDSECSEFQGQLDDVLGYIEKLKSVSVEGVEPTAYASPVFDQLRDDIARPCLTQEEVMKLAPDQGAGQIRVPKVVDN